MHLYWQFMRLSPERCEHVLRSQSSFLRRISWSCARRVRAHDGESQGRGGRAARACTPACLATPRPSLSAQHATARGAESTGRAARVPAALALEGARGAGGGRVPHRGLPVPGRAGRARPFGLGGEQRGGAQQRSEDDVPDGSGRHGRPGGQGEGGARAARPESSTGEGGARAARPESTTGWRGADANPGVRPATKSPTQSN